MVGCIKSDLNGGSLKRSMRCVRCGKENVKEKVKGGCPEVARVEGTVCEECCGICPRSKVLCKAISIIAVLLGWYGSILVSIVEYVGDAFFFLLAKFSEVCECVWKRIQHFFRKDGS